MQTFRKFHGAGNDFILLEDFDKTFSLSLVQELCDRRFGIGADGLILARHSQIADFEMIYFNRDGSQPAFCGNGLRCFVHFLRDLGYMQTEYKIEIAGKILTVKCEGSKIFTFLPYPRIMFWEVPLFSHRAYVIDTGVPHVVIFAHEEIAVHEEGRRMQQHELFQPEGANANFLWKNPHGFYSLRTYERGVGETLACASGAAASAFVLYQLGLCEKEVKILTRSNEFLEIEIGEEIGVTGPTKKVFEGSFQLGC